MSELKQCPFCGGTDLWIDDFGHVHCRTPECDHLEIPQDRWNRRAPDPDLLAQRVKRLEGLLREWRDTPFFATEADWREWVQTYGPRVDAALEEKPYTDPMDGTRRTDKDGYRL